MSSFLFALSAVLPVILTVVLGYLIKRAGFADDALAKKINKLVFHVFLPVLLFSNVYSIESLAAIDFGYIAYAVAAVTAIFLIGIPVAMALTKREDRRGPLLQAMFRSNYAFIGLPLAESLFGAEGLAAAALMSAVCIPLFNILAVIALSLFREGENKVNLKKVLLGIVKNPLIQGIFAGIFVLFIRMIFVKYGITFRLFDITPLKTVVGYLSGLATPLALLMLGVQFNFSTVRELRREILSGTVIRNLLVPVLGLGAAFLFFREQFSGAAFASFVAVFCTPVAISTVPMTQEMGSDATLAGQLVIWTTPLSAVSVFVATLLLRMAGIF